MLSLKLVRYIPSSSCILLPISRQKNHTSWTGSKDAKRSLCIKQNKNNVDRRDLSTYVDSIRKQFTIKEMDSDCTEALKIGKFVLYNKGNALMSSQNRNDPIFLERSQLEEIFEDSTINSQSAFLKIGDDEFENRPLFAFSLPKEIEETTVTNVEASFKGKFTNLRIAMLFGGEYCNILSGGYSLLKWLHNTNFCSKCGSRAENNVPGSRIVCTNDKCGAIFYPPTSPVGIVLVASQNHSHVLLVRQPKYPVGMYSCVAGFVDIGESLYDCVKREVAEEAGVEILPNTSSNFKVISV